MYACAAAIERRDSPNFAGDLGRHCTRGSHARARRIKGGEKKKIAMIALAGSSVSIVGLYDGILTVQFPRVFIYDSQVWRLRRGRKGRNPPSLPPSRARA